MDTTPAPVPEDVKKVIKVVSLVKKYNFQIVFNSIEKHAYVMLLRLWPKESLQKVSERVFKYNGNKLWTFMMGKAAKTNFLYEFLVQLNKAELQEIASFIITESDDDDEFSDLQDSSPNDNEESEKHTSLLDRIYMHLLAYGFFLLLENTKEHLLHAIETKSLGENDPDAFVEYRLVEHFFPLGQYSYAIHTGFSCNICKITPICGIRYQLTSRADEDYCHGCRTAHLKSFSDDDFCRNRDHTEITKNQGSNRKHKKSGKSVIPEENGSKKQKLETNTKIKKEPKYDDDSERTESEDEEDDSTEDMIDLELIEDVKIENFEIGKLQLKPSSRLPASAAFLTEVIDSVKETLLDIIKQETNKEHGKSIQTLYKDTWEPQIAQLREQAVPQPIYISIIGSSGVGKSSLINSILGDILLPTGCSGEACTSGAVEIGYHDADYYLAEVEFITRLEWIDLRQTLLSDFDEANSINLESYKILQVLYGVNFPRNKDAAISEIKRKRLTNAHLGKILNHQSANARELGISLKKYTANTNYGASEWPLVKKVRIFGPFECLKRGVVLVDLPGFNDSVSSRAAVTENYLKQCKYAWIVTRIERSVTDASAKLLLTNQFRQQVLSGNMVKSMAIIATHSDSYTYGELTQEYDSQEAPAVLTKMRNKQVRNKLKENLQEELRAVWNEMIASASESQAEDIPQLEIQNVPVFTVSSKEYLLLQGKLNEPNQNLLFNNLEDTGVPSLQKFILDSSVDFKSPQILEDLLHLLAMIVSPEISAENKNEIEAQFEDFMKDFKNSFSAEKEEQHLKNLLNKCLVANVEKSVKLYENEETRQEIYKPYAKMYCATLRATVSRAGEFKTKNINNDIGNKIVTGTTVGWLQLFVSMRMYLAEYKKTLEKDVTALTDQISMFFHQRNAPASHHQVLLNSIDQQWEQLSNSLAEHERTLPTLVATPIKNNMKPYYNAAKKHRGRGCMARMVGSVAEGINHFEMYQNTKESMLEAINKGFISDIVSHLEAIHNLLCKQIQHQYSTLWQHKEMGNMQALASLQSSVREQQKVLLEKLKEEKKLEQQFMDSLNTIRPSDTTYTSTRTTNYSSASSASFSDPSLSSSSSFPNASLSSSSSSSSSSFPDASLFSSSFSDASTSSSLFPHPSFSSSSQSQSPSSSMPSSPSSSSSSTFSQSHDCVKVKVDRDTIKMWDSKKVGDWLREIGLSKFIDQFEEAGVDGNTLLRVKKEELKTDFNYKLGDVITLWDAITELRGLSAVI